jgi:hypothetical protein
MLAARVEAAIDMLWSTNAFRGSRRCIVNRLRNDGEDAILRTFGGSKETATAGCINGMTCATSVEFFMPGSRTRTGN